MTSTAASDHLTSGCDAVDDDWLLWCRLCAKEDHLGNLSVFFKDEQRTPLGPTAIVGGSNKELSLMAAIQQYFGVNINHSEDLPEMLCAKCYSLVTSLVEFGNRVSRVQEMFRSLHNSNVRTKSDLHAARLKYGFVDGDHDPVLEQQSSPEVHYFDEKPQLNGLEENGLQVDVTVSNPLESPHFKIEIEKENLLERLCMENAEEIASKSDCDNESFQDEDFYTGNGSCKMTTSENEQETDTVHKIILRRRSLPLCGDYNELSNWRRESLLIETNKKKERKRGNIGVDIQSFACAVCSRKFQRRDHFQQHMERVHFNFEHLSVKLKGADPCPYCNKHFHQLDMHIRYSHKKERSFICEECGKAFFTITALNTHKLSHTDYAPFECDLCQKRFKDKVRLKRHFETHDPRKHTCPECSQQLNSRTTLIRHLLVHSDEMQHKCDYCGRAFKRAKTLKSHLILHTGLKPYSCDFCPRTFANGSNCRTHKKKHHPEELASLEASGNGKRRTRNIPNLETLREVTKTAENLQPVVSKQSGNFAFGKKREKPLLPRK